MTRRGLMLILSSPSGAGKTTLSRRLLAREAQSGGLMMSVSVTTRSPRPGEVDGKDYFFVDHKRFLDMASNGQMLEHAQVFDHHYGTPAAFVADHTARGVDVLFDIDWQGTRQITQKARADVVSIFILPPSMEELRHRLQSRAQDSAEVVEKRMAKARAEISHWGEYDYVLINDDLEQTLGRIACILAAERLKRERQTGLPAFVGQL